MQISTLFNQDVKLLNELVSLLSKEQGFLINMDIDDIEKVLDDKSVLIKQISASSAARHQALGKAGYDANENGMATWVRSIAEQALGNAWQAFQSQLEQAKELNRVNGQMINQHFKRNQQTLNQLQGKVPNAAAGVYGPNGQTATPSHTRSTLAV